MTSTCPEFAQFPYRANISFGLSDDVLAHVTELNKMIVDSDNHEISFLGDLAVIPHITLLMGEIACRDDYELLTRELAVFCNSKPPISYRIGRPYLRQPSQHFIFVDVHPQTAFRDFRQDLFDEVGHLIECEHHGGPSNVSHVTVGYAPQVYSGLPELVRRSRRVCGDATRVQLCSAGKRGTCMQVLCAFDLRRS